MTMRKVILIAAMLIAPALCQAQTAPGFSYGQVPTAGQWNSYFASKQDLLGYSPVNRAGDTMTGALTVPSATISGALVIPQGTPGSSSAACATGMLSFNASYLYICVAPNTWRRAATSSF